MKHEEVTQKIIGAFYTVYNTLGYGFLEKVYENALAIELQKLGLKGACQYPVNVYYDGQVVGEYFADLVIDDVIALELKAGRAIIDEHIAQTLNYLKATGLRLAIILNFGPKKMEFKRLAM